MRTRAVPVTVAAALLCGGCSLAFPPEEREPAPAPAAETPAPAPGDRVRETLLETALGQIGRPYRYGGGDGDGFDCSGLAQHVYFEAGIELPRTAAEQRGAGRSIALAEAQPGDLVFFHIAGRTHVGIYVGDGRVVHAPAAGKTVTVTAVTTSYWRSRLAGVVRILK